MFYIHTSTLALHCSANSFTNHSSKRLLQGADGTNYKLPHVKNSHRRWRPIGASCCERRKAYLTQFKHILQNWNSTAWNEAFDCFKLKLVGPWFLQGRHSVSLSLNVFKKESNKTPISTGDWFSVRASSCSGWTLEKRKKKKYINNVEGQVINYCEMQVAFSHPHMRPNFINGSKCKEALIELISLGDDGREEGAI